MVAFGVWPYFRKNIHSFWVELKVFVNQRKFYRENCAVLEFRKIVNGFSCGYQLNSSIRALFLKDCQDLMTWDFLNILGPQRKCTSRNHIPHNQFHQLQISWISSVWRHLLFIKGLESFQPCRLGYNRIEFKIVFSTPSEIILVCSMPWVLRVVQGTFGWNYQKKISRC